MDRSLPAVAVLGRGLVSTLGGDLADAVLRVAGGAPPMPRLRQLAPGEIWPHFPLDHPGAGDWYGRASVVTRAAMEDAGAMNDRGLPLFLASSSVNVGAVEQGCAPGPDAMAFGERVAQWLDWQGPLYWINTACTSAINAVATARRMMAIRRLDAAVVLGLELDNRYSASGFAAMQLLSPRAPRPLAADRDGLVLGEAAAVLRLGYVDGNADLPAPETGPAGRPTGVSSGHKNSGESPLGGAWRIVGTANRIDGSDPAGASAKAVAAMTREALADAGKTASEVDLIKLQAAGSPHNDAAEIAGLRAVFDDLPPLLSLKPWLGHTLGAAGAAELALLLGCLDAGVWPAPPANASDPALLPLAANLPPSVNTVLFVILGFGGGHAALVLERGRS